MSEAFSNDTPQARALRAFEALAACEDTEIDLAHAALLIACTEYPDLDIQYYLAQLDALALRVRGQLALPAPALLTQLPAETDLLAVLAAINMVLFEQEHFHGNTEDYYNPANSFLNEVLEKHVGIPIALSTLYMEIGKRVGMHLDGIGLPYHFVVGCSLPTGKIYIDTYQSGRIYQEQECRERVQAMLGGKKRLHAQWFEPVSTRQLLVRMLNNLKHIYLHKEDYERALAICERIVLLVPRSPLERRDRGIVHLQLKHYARALRDLRAYVALVPKAADAAEIQRQIKVLRQMIAMMN